MSQNLVVGFIGNPNCGKTTLFNAFTGANLKVANWPGVTVEKVEGALKYHNNTYRLVDLPGTYSLTSYTMEEQVSRQYILSDDVDVIVDVADASSLERNLYLTLQLLELGKPVVLALNMMDIVEKRGMETFLGNLNRDIRAANSLMQSIRSAIRGLQRWIADLNEKKQLLLDALEKAKEPTLSDLLVDYFNLRNEQRSDWSGKAKLKCTVRDFEEVKRAVDYLKTHSLNTIEDLDTAISNLNQTAAPLRRQLKQNEDRMRAIAQIKDAAAVHAKLKPIHDTFIKKNFKLTKDAYAAQHKDELDAFNKAVRTLMKLNGSTAVDFSALDAEFSALQSGSAELRTKLETLQPDVSALKNIRKYIDMVLNKQQLSAPGGKTSEKESVLKQLEQLQQKKSNYKTISTTPNREESL